MRVLMGERNSSSRSSGTISISIAGLVGVTSVMAVDDFDDEWSFFVDGKSLSLVSTFLTMAFTLAMRIPLLAAESIVIL